MAPRPAPRPVVVAPPPAPVAAQGVNFGDLGFYAGGFQLPPGRWAIWFTVQMFQPTKQDGTPVGKAPRLGVMLDAYSLDKPDADPFNQFLSMGSKTDQSFAPGPDGKSLVAIPGANAATAPKTTNWGLFLKSLYDTGLQPGVFTNDVTPIDGIWVQTDLVPEPEDRKSFGKAKTGESAQEPEERQGSGLIPIVTEILDGGKPWEGGGGLPAAPVPAAALPAARPAARPSPQAAPAAVAPRPAPRQAAAPTPPPAPPAEEAGDVEAAAQAGITEYLTANPNGDSKLKVRTATFKYVKAAYGEETAQAVTGLFDSGDAGVNAVLAPLGYHIVGTNIVPTA